MRTRKARLKNGLTLSLAGERTDETNLLTLHPPGGGPFLLSLTLPGSVGSKVLQGARLHYAALLAEDLLPADLSPPKLPLAPRLTVPHPPPQDLSPLEAFRWAAFEAQKESSIPSSPKNEEPLRDYLASYAAWECALPWGSLSLFERRAYLLPVQDIFHLMRSSREVAFRERIRPSTLLQDYSWFVGAARLLREKDPSGRRVMSGDLGTLNLIQRGCYDLIPLLPDARREEVASLTSPQVEVLTKMPKAFTPAAAEHLFTLLQEGSWPSAPRRKALLKVLLHALRGYVEKKKEAGGSLPRGALLAQDEWRFERRTETSGPQSLALMEYLLQEASRGNTTAEACLEAFFQGLDRPIFLVKALAHGRLFGDGFFRPLFMAEEEYLLSCFLQEMSLEEFLPQLLRFLLLPDPLSVEEALQYLSSWRVFREMPSSWWLPLLKAEEAL